MNNENYTPLGLSSLGILRRFKLESGVVEVRGAKPLANRFNNNQLLKSRPVAYQLSDRVDSEPQTKLDFGKI